jgi:hypothetical protein
MSDASSFLASISSRATSGISEREERISQLKAEAQNLRRWVRFADDLEGFRSHNCPGAALELLSGRRSQREAIVEHDPTTEARFASLEAELAELVRENLRRTAELFPAALAAHGLELDSTSRDPKYTVAGRYITATFDKTKPAAHVQVRGEKRRSVPPDPRGVADKVAEEHVRLFGREVDPQRTVDRLKRGWRQARGADGSASVPIKQVFKALAKDEDGFVRDEFVVDIAELLKDSGSSAIFEGLKLDHTRDDKQGVLLAGLESRGYFGYISFETDGSQG